MNAHPSRSLDASGARDPRHAGANADGNPAPEPSTEDQVDIADRVQKGLGKANDRERTREGESVGKAPAIDGNPAPEADTDGGVFKPADDTPVVLPKKSGPKD